MTEKMKKRMLDNDSLMQVIGGIITFENQKQNNKVPDPQKAIDDLDKEIREALNQSDLSLCLFQI